jgi:hypothetical protein
MENVSAGLRLETPALIDALRKQFPNMRYELCISQKYETID